MTPPLSEEEITTFFEILNRNDVQYIVIGGAAVNIHGYTRATGDIDIWYNPTKNNFLKLLKSINEFGFDTSELANVTEYETKGFIRIPLDRFYIELLSVIDGKIKFDEAYNRTFGFTAKNITIKVIGYDDLIQNKIMSRRPKDLEDITQLERRRKAEGDATKND